MTLVPEWMPGLRGLEGRRVGVALVDGSRFDDCQLVSAPHRGVDTVWLYSDGTDVFVAAVDVADLWELAPRDVARTA